MTKMMDYMISPLPIRIADLKVDPSKLKIFSLMVLQVGHLPGRTLKREKVIFDKWAIIFITGGEGVIQSEKGSVYKIKAGSMFFVYPGLTVAYGPTDYWDEYYIRFQGSRVKEWISSKLIMEELYVTNIEIGSNWIDLIESIYSKINSGLPDDADLAALLLEQLIFNISQCHGIDTSEKCSKKKLFQSIIENLTSSLDVPLDSMEIAKSHHISVSTLRRVIKENSGYPLNEYYHRLKVELAKNRLITTDESIKEISLNLGYTDQYYFSRVFKKVSGMSPQHFRDYY